MALTKSCDASDAFSHLRHHAVIVRIADRHPSDEGVDDDQARPVLCDRRFQGIDRVRDARAGIYPDAVIQGDCSSLKALSELRAFPFCRELEIEDRALGNFPAQELAASGNRNCDAPCQCRLPNLRAADQDTDGAGSKGLVPEPALRLFRF